MKPQKIYLICVLALSITACSSGSPPRQELAMAQGSIRAAVAAGAVEHAAKPLRSAQQRVEKAQTLTDQEQYDEAKRQLEFALADAELAEAMAEAGNSEIANRELQLSIALMKEEIARVQDQ